MAQFKTRARALDLLGRQQIAGIPTAINELIKNAYDAYADNFDVDYFRSDKLLILRDDGIGMTKADFETRWLTLGTESKLSNIHSSLPPIDSTKEKRAITGEKGIGRLAIASIGQQVLILTKAKYASELASTKIVAAFINWDLFELPGINLEDIVIPVREFNKIPDERDINAMKQEILDGIHVLRDKGLIIATDYERIERTINSFSIAPNELLEKTLPGVTNFISSTGGTHFYISPVNDILNSDIDGEEGRDEATKMEKMLLGFHDTMTPNHQKTQIDIAFREYRNDDGSFVSIIDKEHFFTPEEFVKADHQFTGTFDKFGQFKGDIRIYGEKTYKDYTVNWKDNHYRETLCGPFAINFAYIQGEQKSSRLSVEDYARLKAKGDKFGGLYIYRNNIRVLPYGDSDYDFLDVEKNRSKRAATAFFSYRRMFGAISILETDRKSLLIEKAGREGFIENKAYKELRSILKNFLWQLAADFFNDNNSPYSEFFKQKKEEFNTHYAALEKREKMNRGKKNKFLKELTLFFERLTSHEFESNVQLIIDNFSNQLIGISSEKDNDIASEKLLQAEFEVRKKIAEYKKIIAVPSPKGFVVSKTSRQDYDAYCEEYGILVKTTFKEAEEKIDTLIEAYTKTRNLEISKRKRLEQAVELISTEAKSVNQKKRNETNEVVTSISKKVKELTSELVMDLDKQIQNVRNQFIELKTHDTGMFDLVTERQRMENEIESISVRNTDLMDRIIRQFESFYIEKDNHGNFITNDQIEDSLSEELESLREQVQADVELSQLGLAVGIIHHEFNSTITSIRHSLKDLKAWSDADENLEGIYKNIKINFEHLDRYLALMMPLNRRLYREREDIPNSDIKSFLNDLFKNRLERHGIDFRQTNGFSHGHIYGFRSTFYPVFVNIIDNAIYWLSQSEQPQKIIRLHADETGVYISNNGPAILPQDKDRIFDLRFSRKPHGRGMGLNISKEILNGEGYDLLLIEPLQEVNVTFKIQKQ